jgi:ABC-type multidrug transport system ATPase subunit
MNISVQNVTKTYPKGKTALSGIDISLDTPALIGLLGPNGAGKSTLMKLLTLNLLPTSGKITLDGAPLIVREKSLKERLGYLPQEYGLYEELTVWQFLDYMAAMKGITKNSREQIDRAIEFCSLEEKGKSKIRTLSGGFKQRVGIAQAILGSPELMILDEPTVGLDPEERLNFRNRFSEAAKNKIVILSTHIIEDIQSVCNRLIVLNKGKILYDGEPEGLISLCRGHVGTCEHSGGSDEIAQNERFKITSKIVTHDKTSYRIVAEELPPFASPAAPSLEDAYMYVMAREEAAE